MGTFIKKIKNDQIVDLYELIPDLERCASIVNLAKHSLVGMGSEKSTLYLWDMKTRQAVYLSEEERNNNIKTIQQAIQVAKTKLSRT